VHYKGPQEWESREWQIHNNGTAQSTQLT